MLMSLVVFTFFIINVATQDSSYRGLYPCGTLRSMGHWVVATFHIPGIFPYRDQPGLSLACTDDFCLITSNRWRKPCASLHVSLFKLNLHFSHVWLGIFPASQARSPLQADSLRLSYEESMHAAMYICKLSLFPVISDSLWPWTVALTPDSSVHGIPRAIGGCLPTLLQSSQSRIKLGLLHFEADSLPLSLQSPYGIYIYIMCICNMCN